MPQNQDPQKSEVHESTADASTSPTAAGDSRTTRQQPGQRRRTTPKRHPEPLSPDTTIVQDDSDDGGPIVVESADPELNPPQTPKDPFPTNRTPEIDPPVK